MPRGGGAVAEGGGVGDKPGEHAHDVAVDAGGARPEGQAGDRRGGVRTHARQILPALWRGRRGGQGRQRLRQPAQIAGARVVAEPFPEFEDLSFGSSRQRGEIRQRRHPAFEKGQGGFDLRLLQHELGDHRPVERRLRAPGQLAMVLAIPHVQGASEGGTAGDQALGMVHRRWGMSTKRHSGGGAATKPKPFYRR